MLEVGHTDSTHVIGFGAMLNNKQCANGLEHSGRHTQARRSGDKNTTETKKTGNLETTNRILIYTQRITTDLGRQWSFELPLLMHAETSEHPIGSTRATSAKWRAS